MRSEQFRRSAARHTLRRNMRNLYRPHMVGMLGILGLAVVGLVIFLAAQTAHAAPIASTVSAMPPGGYVGSPAIRLTKTDRGPITAADVINYVQASGMPRTLGPRYPITDVHPELLTSAEISMRLHGESTGYSDNALLWFVEMRGIFVFPGPPGSQSITSHTGYQVFDPESGNLIMFGGLG